MLRPLFYTFIISLLSACTAEKTAEKTSEETAINTAPVKLPAARPGEAVATFAGGCFWSFEENFELLNGVREAVSGYAGGEQPNPTYEQVSTDKTGHAEAVQVYYDPKVISYDTLAKAFLYAHDPSTLNRQGPDVGTQYRSMAFFRTPAEQASLAAAVARYNADRHHAGDPVVTEVVPFKAFYPAETYHQGYYRTHLDEFYIRSVSIPKVAKFKEHLTDKLKPQPAS